MQCRPSKLPCFLLLIVGWCLPPIKATTYIARSLVEMTQDAAFIGTVECEVAGGIVAEYRVLESWKGKPKAGERVRLRIHPDEFGPSFPIALSGERFVVFAWDVPESNYRMGGLRLPPLAWSSPLMWRSLRFDYQTDHFQSLVKLDARNGAAITAQQKRQVLQFLQGDADQRELAMLRGAFERQRPSDVTSVPVAQVTAALKRIPEVASARELVHELNQLRIFGGNEWREMVNQTLGHGSTQTLEFLGPYTDTEFPEKAGILRQLEYFNSRARGTRIPVAQPTEHEIPQPSDKEMEAVIQSLRHPGDESTYRSVHAYAWMVVHRSETVLAALLSWTPPPHRLHQWDTQGYALGSMLAKYCPSNRVSVLTSLLKAKDPFVRVSAGVHLCFDDPAAGQPALERLQAEPGDAGAWAALTLARYGRKASVDRALDLLASDPAAGSFPPATRLYDLRGQLLVLLSNGARAAGLSLPETPHGKVLREWWTKNSDRIPLKDPWMLELKDERSD